MLRVRGLALRSEWVRFETEPDPPIDAGSTPMFFENLIKYSLIAVTYKIWWPILKTMWNELQGALWREGGLLGGTPGPRELILLEEKYGHIESPLTNETYAQVKLREQWEEEQAESAKRGGSDVVQPAARRTAPHSGQGSGQGSKETTIGPADYGRPRGGASATSSQPSAKGGFGAANQRGF